ncbi:MAG: alpha-2-macroglobulin [Planctomycetales bacterium]|nr:alpha-2-macroglobulin [Planctomycetales bacterium]
MFRTSWTVALGLALAAVGGLSVLASAEPPDGGPLQRVDKMFDDGNFAEALAEYRQLTTGPDEGLSSQELATAFSRAAECFARLNQLDELDAYREEVAGRHADDWVVLLAVATNYENNVHYGYQIAGKFSRGQHRGGGKVMHATARDRVRTLQLCRQALEAFEKQAATAGSDSKPNSQGRGIFDRLAAALMMDASGRSAWRLQTLTNLDELPDYEEGWGYGGTPQGAPVDAAGEPVVYEIPDSWDAAANDGERWRWTLAERTRIFPDLALQEQLDRAAFLRSQFGVDSLAQFGWSLGRSGDDGAETGTYALHTLAEDETIARLATGVKRFRLPAGHDHIALLKQVAEKATPGSNEWRDALESLGSLFENRRQYPRAAENWQQIVDGPEHPRVAQAKARLQQITGAWGRLEPAEMQPAGSGATLDYRFRNGKRAEFVARAIDVRKLLGDVKKYLAASPREMSWDQISIDNLGYRLVQQGQQQYVGAEAARWMVELDPRPNHFDRRTTVATPLTKPGAYLVTAKMDGGNEQSVVLWVADTAIVKKPLEGAALYYVADAVTGQPVAKANVEFFGWRQEQAESGKYRVETKNFAEFTDAAGMVQLAGDEPNQRCQWLAIATTPDGRLAHLGFSNVWSGRYLDQQYKQVKAYALTDRPVYRPGDEVQFKFWIRTAQYDATAETDAEFAAKSFLVEIRDPRNEKVYSQTLTSDKYGGIVGKWELPAGATLGQYQLFVVNHGGGSFRVEEYKKPEFEVTIAAPDEPLMLGEQATATITAKYYFGSPVVNAKVRYKILRSEHSATWYPPMPWDWLYGPGYWWFAESYDWYPGWARWGCGRPWPWWWWRQPSPPEVIAEQEVEIGPDGTVEIAIDTLPAKELHGDQDHRYEITAEVTDESRRTITATGQVLVARQPYRVFLWTDRGYYRAGDPMQLEMAARTLDGKGVKGGGTLRLLSIEYVDGKPVETEVAKWDLPTGDDGTASLQIKASEPGQYRLAYEVIDAANHRIEGGQVITVRGNGFDGGDFRFNDLEVIPDRREYAPGDKVALQVNVNRRNATVLLFVRPANGVYLPPQVHAIVGKSAVIEVPVEARDMPNFFVEAVAVHGGKAYTVAREIFVPPTKRVVDVEVVPSSDAYLPGQDATINLKVTSPDGSPAVGSLVVAVYDKALDYIAGGAAPADIREFFWKWRREHRPQSETNLGRWEAPVSKPGAEVMQDIGLFGATSVDDLSVTTRGDLGVDRDMPMRSRRVGGLGGGGYGGEFMPESATAMPMFAPVAAESRAMGRHYNSIDQLAADKSELGGAAAAEVAPQVRENFADTALWVGSLETDANGLAEVSLTMPENLTAWKIGAWSMGAGTQVGQGSAEAVTRKNIIVRLQAPRFFVERDEVVLSANVHNYLDHAKTVRVKLDLEGGALVGSDSMEQSIEIAAGDEQRVDWRVNAVHEGTAVVRASALTDEESDAMQMSFPVLVHGMLKQESFSGVLRPDDGSGQFTITVPRERRPEKTRLELRYSPTLAGAMIEALPYLIDYPYGCTEQTLNRFLPAVLTQRTLQRMGVDLAALKDKRTNLNAQEIGDPAERAAQWKRFDENPVFDEAQLGEIVKAGVNRLAEMQLSDGGWGWFSGWGEHSSPHTTAVVLRGLLVAEQNDVALVPGVLERGVDWLARYQQQQLALLDAFDRQADKVRVENASYKRYADDLDAYVQMVLVQAGRGNPRMRSYLYADRTHLAPYAVALFGLSLHHETASPPDGGGDDSPPANDQQPATPQNAFAPVAPADMLAMVVRNLSQYVQQDDENQTAWLNLPGGYWWQWYGSEYEAQAAYLKLLVAAEPDSPVASRMVKYLLNNRKHASYWNSTRDTALVVEAFADYLQATGEAQPNLQVEIWIDGERQKSVSIDAGNLFTFDGTLVIEGADLAAGKHVVEFRKTGEGSLYYNGYLTNFTLEDPIEAAGLELKIDRKFYRLVREETETDVAGAHGQAISQRTEKYRREPIVNLEKLASGDLVEIELIVDSKNDYEYVMLEDRKAAGFEPVEVRSGYNGNDMGAYVEYRDQKVALFVRSLMRGRHSVSYRLRAEIPGKFSALPATAAAMYAPELKANSDEMKVRVVDRVE